MLVKNKTEAGDRLAGDRGGVASLIYDTTSGEIMNWVRLSENNNDVTSRRVPKRVNGASQAESTHVMT